MSPSLYDQIAKIAHRLAVARHSKISVVPVNHRFEPLSCFRDGIMHADYKLSFNRLHFRMHPLLYRLPFNGKLTSSRFTTDMRESEKCASFRFLLLPLTPIFSCKSAKLYESRFLRMQFQPELLESFLQFFHELLGIRAVLKSNNCVVRATHHGYFAARSLAPPLLDPQIVHIVQIHVGKQRRCAAPGESANGSSPLAARKTVRETLASYGFH